MERLFFFRSSHRRCYVRKGVLRNYTKFTRKHLCQNLFFNKVVSLDPATLLKMRLWNRWLSVNVVNFLRNTFSYRTPVSNCFCFFRTTIDLISYSNVKLGFVSKTQPILKKRQIIFLKISLRFL